MNNSKTVLIDGNKPETKKNIAKKLYMNYHTLDRRSLIHKFVEELHITENSARTHISWCAKELNPLLNKPIVTRKIDESKCKKGQAYNLFVNNNISRNEMIKLFQKELDMTRNSAITHCSMCAKRYSESVNTNHKAIGNYYK